MRTACLGVAATLALMAQMPGPGRGPKGFGGPHGMGFAGPHGMGFGLYTGKPVTGAPFSALATVNTTRTLANGNQIQNQHQSKIYRDSQGRVRTETTFTKGTGANQTTRTVITIYDPVGGKFYRLNPQDMTAVQRPLPQNTTQMQPGTGTGPGGAGMETGANGEQIQTKDLGTQTINGVTATGKQVTVTIPAGAIGNTQPIQSVRVTWTSTALQIPVQITFTDPRFGTRTMNLTNIVTTEPPASLFQVPSNYTVTTAPGRGGFGGRFGGGRQ